MPCAAERLRVLFLCTGNSCRSQMAEGWARALRADSIEPYSAGTCPAGINPLAVRAMAEAGVDIAAQTSKAVGALARIPIDFVVTLCDAAGGVCPQPPGAARVVNVGFDDPPALAKDATTEDEAMPHYRRVCDEIRRFVETLPQSLNGGSTMTERSCDDA